MISVSFDRRVVRRSASATLIAGAAAFVLGGCSLIGPLVPGGHDPQPIESSDATIDPSADSGQDEHAPEVKKAIDAAPAFDTAPVPITVKSGDTAAIKIGDSNESVGRSFNLASNSDDQIGEAEVYTDWDPHAEGVTGVGGTDYLLIRGLNPGTAKLRVVYCWRSVPDANGQCNQEKGIDPGQFIDESFTVEVSS